MLSVLIGPHGRLNAKPSPGARTHDVRLALACGACSIGGGRLSRIAYRHIHLDLIDIADSAKPVPLAVESLDSRQGQWESR